MTRPRAVRAKWLRVRRDAFRKVWRDRFNLARRWPDPWGGVIASVALAAALNNWEREQIAYASLGKTPLRKTP